MTPLQVTLRPYQQAAVDGIYQWFSEHTGNPLVVVPTGGGKSVILSAFIHSVLSQWPSERILMLTHVRELIAQNHAAMLRAWPGAPAGIYSAGLGKREHDAHILFAGIQSVYEKAGKIGWADLVIVDEAHLIPKGGMGMYRKLLDALRSMNPQVKIIGLTATPYRTDSGHLAEGSDRMFHGVAYECDLVQLIADGYLSPVRSKGTDAAIDTTGVHTQAGDFVLRELERRAMDDDLVPRSVAEIVRRGAGRRSWLAFCVGIEHARAVAAEMGKHGIRCATVFGDTRKDERDEVLAQFKAGQIQCIANVGVLTTGFDAPGVDLIALLRPTKSPGLYVQMVGRGLRRADGKTDCLVLDFGGNVTRHGPIDCVRPRGGEGGDGDGTPPVRRCPQCDELVPIATRECACGYLFPEPERAMHEDKPADAPILRGALPAFERWDIQQVRVSRHEKPGKPPSMRVEYWGGFQQRVSEWVCFEHQGFARVKAGQWWVNHGGQLPVPETVDLALVRYESGECSRRVVSVTVDTRGDWPEIRAMRFEVEPGESEPMAPRPAATTVADDDIPF